MGKLKEKIKSSEKEFTKWISDVTGELEKYCIKVANQKWERERAGEGRREKRERKREKVLMPEVSKILS